MNSKSKSKNSKVLLIDLETTAHEGFYWGKNYEVDIVEATHYGKILSYSAKWLGSKKVITRGWIDTKNEKRLVKELWELLNKADVAVAHNGRSFDFKWCNTRFIYYGLTPPSPYKIVDTKTEAKKFLYLPSYSLNNISDYFGLGRKIEHEGFGLWAKCLRGDKRAWNRMKRYNRMDTILLEKVYLKLIAWSAGQSLIPNACSRCGSYNQQSRGWHYKLGIKHKRYSCNSCGAWNIERKGEKIGRPLLGI